MARTSKESSPLGNSGFLFESDSDQTNAAQTPPEASESRPAKGKKKRSSKAAKQDETPQETQDQTPAFDLFAGVSESNVPQDEPQKETSPIPSDVVERAESIPDSFVEESVPKKSDAVSEPEKVVAPVIQAMPEVSDGQAVSSDPQETSSILEVATSDNNSDSFSKSVGEESVSNAKVLHETDTPTPVQPTSDVSKQSRPKPAAYQVVARRYRPQAFDELIGQETVARALSNAIETNRVGHAYLFTGARGVGKTSCARIFAKALNCVEGPTTHPCLKCDSCIAISTGEDVDVIEIDGASNRGVDEIRQLRQNAAIAPSRSHFKIYIIDEVHMLTREAFNALLKTLEEPPARVKFIFCTTEPNKIPVTILSRCQRFDFNSINGTSIAQRLEQIAKQEGAQAEEGVFDVLARRANGSMRDAQSLLEQLLSFAPDYVTQADVHNMLGSVDDKKIFDLLDATVKGDAKRVFETLGAAAAQGVDFGTLTEQTFGVYRDLMIVASGCGPKELAYSPIARFDELKGVAKAFGIRRILASLQILDQTIQRMRYSAQSRILAELAFARLCRLDAFQVIEELLNQLKKGAIPSIPINLPPAAQSVLEEDKKKRIVELAQTEIGSPSENTIQSVSASIESPVVAPEQESANAVEASIEETVQLSSRAVETLNEEALPTVAEIVEPTKEETNFSPVVFESPSEETFQPPVDFTEPPLEEETCQSLSQENVDSSSPSDLQSTLNVSSESIEPPNPDNEFIPQQSKPNSEDDSEQISPSQLAGEEHAAFWLKFSKSELAKIWNEATNSGIILPTHAGAFFEINTEAPNSFIVVFPGSCQMQRDYCENERVAIESRIASQLGGTVVLRLVVDQSIKASASKSPTPNYDSNDRYREQGSGFKGPRQERNNSRRNRSISVADFQELHRQVDNCEVAHEIQEVFEAELSEIKPAAKNYSRWGNDDDQF